MLEPPPLSFSEGRGRSHLQNRASTKNNWSMGWVAVYSMSSNGASGPYIGLPGRILAGLLPGNNRNRPAGRPKAGWRAYFGAFPVAVRQNPTRKADLRPGSTIA